MVYFMLMAISCKVGRPYHVADINFRHDPDQDLYDTFYAACDQLHYFDTVLLSRALGVNIVTIRLWKAHKTFPSRRGMAYHVIDWVNRGKPEKIIKQAEITRSML